MKASHDMTKRFLVAGVALILALPVSAQIIVNGPFKVADNTDASPLGAGNFPSFSVAPSVDHGMVAFRSGDGTPASVSLPTSATGVYLRRVDGAAPYVSGGAQFIADTDTILPGDTTRFRRYGAPSVDGRSRSAAFLGTRTQFNALNAIGVYRSTGGPTPEVVADRATEVPVPTGEPVAFFTTFPEVPPSMDGDLVVFRASSGPANNPDYDGIYLSDGVTIRVIADLSTPVPGGVGTFQAFGTPMIDNGLVVFSGGATADAGIYVSDGDTVTVIADTATLTPDGGTFQSFGTAPAIDDGNVVFFAEAQGSGGGAAIGGIYTTLGGELSTVAVEGTAVPGTNTTFNGFQTEPAIDGDRIAFGATTAIFNFAGIYVAHPAGITKVVNLLDDLGGKNVDLTTLGREGFKDGVLAFFVRLEDQSGARTNAIYAAVLDGALEQTLIDFDSDATGTDIADGALIDEQYADVGVHFGGGYHAASRATWFPAHAVRPSANYLCTFDGAAEAGCQEPDAGDGPLVVNLDFSADFASIEAYTQVGIADDDSLRIEAFDGKGVSLGASTATCSNAPDAASEGVCVAWVEAAGIRRLEIQRDGNDGTPDAIDTLVLVEGVDPAPEPKPGDLVGDNDCVDLLDFEHLFNIIIARQTDPDLRYDLNGDGRVNVIDVRYLVGMFDNPGGEPCVQ